MSSRPTPATAESSDPLGQVTDKIDVALPQLRRPGKRKHRIADLRVKIEHSLRERHPHDDDLQIDAKVEAKLRELTSQPTGVVKTAAAIAPTSVTKPARDVRSDVEDAAVFRLPRLIWLRHYLTRRSSGPRWNSPKAPLRTLVAAVLLHMGLTRNRPEITHLREQFLRADAWTAWAHFYPDKGPDPKSFFKAIEKVVEREEAHVPELIWQVNADLLRETLGPLVDDEREPRCPSKRLAHHPNALRHLLVDATLVEAHVDQASALNPDHHQLKVGPGRERVAYVMYSYDDGTKKKSCYGYKLMVISDLATAGLPLIWSLVPANADERQETLRLLPKLFELFPEMHELRDIHLVGDALYDHSEEFARELVFKWGIHPVFPEHGAYSSDYPWAATKGVPACPDCGQVMKFRETEGFPTPYERRRKGLPRCGEWVRKVSGEKVDDARIRWSCPDKTCGATATTCPKDNPRLYTALPRDGGSNPANLRRALLSYRNVIESGFAALEDMGLAGEGQMRPKFAEDVEMEWLLSLGLMSRTARRLVHLSGLYDATYAEARADDLLSQPTLNTPAPGPANRTNAEALAWHNRHLALAEAPADWPELAELDLPPCRPDGVTPYYGP